MKIILLTDSLGAGGAQRQLVGLAKLLKQRQQDVTVVTYHDIVFFKGFLDQNDIENIVLQNSASPLQRLRNLYNFLKKSQPDCVISYQSTPSLYACLCKMLLRSFKLVVSERNTTQKMSLYTRILYFLYHQADAIVPNSYAQENFMISKCKWMRKKIKTITNFVDLNKFEFLEHSRSLIPEIIVVATIKKSKNVHGLIEATKILKEKGLNFHISWYGYTADWKQYFDMCNENIRQYGLSDYIQLLEKTSKIEEKYHNADYLCLPSFFEGTPNAICEACSSGLPIICSDVCDNHLYVISGENGFLFNPHDVSDIAFKIQEAISMSSEKYHIARKMSRAIAEEKLSDQVFVDNYLTIINAND